MHPQLKIVLALSGCLFLGGCWESTADLYESETPLTPFKPGPLTSVDSDGKTSHAVLTLDGKAYRLGLKAGGPDSEVAVWIRLRFFPLANAKADTMVVESEFLRHCKGDICDPVTPDMRHVFALAHLKPDGGAEELAGNCDGDAAQRLGAKQVGGFICDFSDRMALEKALLTLVDTKPVATLSPQ